VADTPTPAKAAVPTTWEGVLELARRAERGDKAALPALREVLKHPAYVDALGGNLARMAQGALVERFGQKNLLVKEALRRKLETLRAELAGPDPSPLEMLLADRIVTCWLHLHHLEMLLAAKESVTFEAGGYYQRCLTSAQKRYLSAIKALAAVRKLALPVLQVNIARKQVNVAGSCVSAEGDRGTS
jgi:hypothetical protein